MNKISYDERKTIYKKALLTWGSKAQTMMAIEEMSELTKAICKNFRGNPNDEDIADEIADVTIMLEQLRLIYGLNDLVCEHMDMKILRLKERLGMEASASEVPEEDEELMLSPKGIATLALQQVNLVNNCEDPRIDGFWKLFETMMRKSGYVSEEEDPSGKGGRSCEPD